MAPSAFGSAAAVSGRLPTRPTPFKQERHGLYRVKRGLVATQAAQMWRLQHDVVNALFAFKIEEEQVRQSLDDMTV